MEQEKMTNMRESNSYKPGAGTPMAERKKKWLVCETSYFYDGHGSGDEGGTRYFITEDKMYTMVDPNKMYGSLDYCSSEDCETDEQIKEMLEEESYSESSLHEQDGYNCEAHDYVVRELSTDEEVSRVKKVLKDYENLMKS